MGNLFTPLCLGDNLKLCLFSFRMSNTTSVVIEDFNSRADMSFGYDGAFRQKSRAFRNVLWDLEREANKQRSATVSATVIQIDTLMMAKNVKTH